MKWLRAVWTDVIAAPRIITDTVFGPKCAVTGERTYPRDRGWHERDQHPGEGNCAP